MDPEKYRKKIERDILIIMEEKLKNGSMDAERARDIARMVLDKLHPPLSLEDIYRIAPTLDDQFTELAAAVLPVMKEHDEKIRTIVTAHAGELARSGKIEEALKMLQDASGKKTE